MLLRLRRFARGSRSVYVWGKTSQATRKSLKRSNVPQRWNPRVGGGFLHDPLRPPKLLRFDEQRSEVVEGACHHICRGSVSYAERQAKGVRTSLFLLSILWREAHRRTESRRGSAQVKVHKRDVTCNLAPCGYQFEKRLLGLDACTTWNPAVGNPVNCTDCILFHKPLRRKVATWEGVRGKTR